MRFGLPKILPEESPRRDNFRVFAVPLDLAAQPASVVVQDPKGLNRALVPILRIIRPMFSWIEPALEYVIEITLACIEYLKSAAVLLDDSDEPKVICLLFFTSDSRDCQITAFPIKPEVPIYRAAKSCPSKSLTNRSSILCAWSNSAAAF
jgi:hypothetical protein